MRKYENSGDKARRFIYDLLKRNVDKVAGPCRGPVPVFGARENLSYLEPVSRQRLLVALSHTD